MAQNFFESLQVKFDGKVEIVPVSGIGCPIYEDFYNAVAHQLNLTREFIFVHDSTEAEIKRIFFINYVQRYGHNLVVRIKLTENLTSELSKDSAIFSLEPLSPAPIENSVPLSSTHTFCELIRDIVVLPSTPLNREKSKNFDSLSATSTSRHISADCITPSLATKNPILGGDLAGIREVILQSQQSVISRYNINPESLSNNKRVAVAKAVISFILDRNPERILRREEFEGITDVILSIFDRGTEIRAVYYTAAESGNAAKGKLFNAYYNKKNILSAAGIITRRKIRIQSEHHSDQTEVNLPTVKEAVEFLEHHIEPWSDVVYAWKETHFYRRQLLSTKISTAAYIEKFFCLLEPQGIELIITDSKLRYPELKPVDHVHFSAVADQILKKGLEFKSATIKKYLNACNASMYWNKSFNFYKMCHEPP